MVHPSQKQFQINPSVHVDLCVGYSNAKMFLLFLREYNEGDKTREETTYSYSK